MCDFILLIEDDPDDEFIGRRVLAKNGFSRIESIRDGRLAMDRLFSEEPLPCLVILDLKLPKVGGLRLLSHIRGNGKTKELPVIVLSSSSNPDEIAAATSYPLTTYLCKPLTEMALKDALAALGVNPFQPI